MDTNQEKLLLYVEEFKHILAGVFIDRPEEKIIIGSYTISRRALKHFVERRSVYNEDIDGAIRFLPEVFSFPEVNIPNPKTNGSDGSVYIGKKMPAEEKALMVIVDKNNEIRSIHFKNQKDFERIKAK